MADESEMTDPPVIAYPPIKRILKIEIPDENQEINTVGEENWTPQLQYTKCIIIILCLYETLI